MATKLALIRRLFNWSSQLRKGRMEFEHVSDKGDGVWAILMSFANKAHVEGPSNKASNQ